MSNLVSTKALTLGELRRITAELPDALEPQPETSDGQISQSGVIAAGIEVPEPLGEEDVQQEEVTVIGSLPLRLAIDPESILQHFEGNERIEALSRQDLLRISVDVLNRDDFYKAFHRCLCDAVMLHHGFDPDDAEK